MRMCWIMTSLCCSLAYCPTAIAEVAPINNELINRDIKTEADTVEASIARRNLLLDIVGENTLTNWYSPWVERREEWLEEHGLELALSYDALSQITLDGNSPSGSAGELALTGRWHVLGSRPQRPIDLRFRVRDRHTYGGRAPSELSGDIGAIWGTANGFTGAGVEVPDFYLSQRYLSRNLELRYGQMVIDSQFDQHSLRGAKQSFLNQAFASNPAVAFPRFGAGVTLHWEGDNGIDVTGGISSVQGTMAGDQVDFDLGSSDFFGAFQVAGNFSGWNGEDARWQVLAWWSDGIEEVGLRSGEGFSATIEQKLNDGHLRCFARIARASGGATDVRTMGVFGLGMDCGETDLFGLGVGVGEANDQSRDLQGVIECFYRLQMGPQLHVTPDLQILVGEGFNDGRNLRAVFGFRGSITF